MFKKILSFMLLVIASMASVAEQENSTNVKKKILVLGVSHHDSDKGRTPFPEGHLLFAKETELRETVDLCFLDRLNEGKDRPFIFANFNDQKSMERFSSKYEGCFDEIHFDWSVLKFLKLENQFCFSSLYKSLKCGGLFYLPDVGLPGHFLSEEVNERRIKARIDGKYAEAEQIVKDDRREQETHYIASLEEKLTEAGFSVEKTTEKDIETSVFFDPIRTRIKSMKRVADVIDGFPVWIAKKIRIFFLTKTIY